MFSFTENILALVLGNSNYIAEPDKMQSLLLYKAITGHRDRDIDQLSWKVQTFKRRPSAMLLDTTPLNLCFSRQTAFSHYRH